MMKLSLYISIICLLAQLSPAGAQEIKSEKSSFRLNNVPVKKEKVIPDKEPPSITLINPDFREDSVFTTRVKDLDLIGKVSDSSGVSFLTIDSEFKQFNENGIFSTRLTLSPGMNRIRIMAMDSKDNFREKILQIEYTPPVVTLADKIKNESVYYGLIIGIEHYKDREIPDLDNPIRDADQLFGTLVNRYTFRPDNIILLKDAKREDIIRSLDELARVVTPEDNLLIFYAGHGWWDPLANNGYWLPADAERNAKTNWFRNSTLVDYLKEIHSKHTLLIADACFGGSIFKTRSAFPNRERAFVKLYELPSRKAMTSGTLTEVPDRSSFTRYLIDRLNENEEEYLSSEQLFSSFRLAVINNSDVIPQYGEISNVGDEGGDFIFLRNK